MPSLSQGDLPNAFTPGEENPPHSTFRVNKSVCDCVIRALTYMIHPMHGNSSHVIRNMIYMFSLTIRDSLLELFELLVLVTT